MKWAVAVTSPDSGERVWVSPTGRLVHDAWRAYAVANAAQAAAFAARLPHFWELEVVEAPDRRPPALEADIARVRARARQQDERIEQAEKSASDWTGTAEKGIQVRHRHDGTPVFRSRRAGQTSPTLESIEAARSWQP